MYSTTPGNHCSALFSRAAAAPAGVVTLAGLAFLTAGWATPSRAAAEPPAPPLHGEIDRLIAAGWAAHKVRPAELSSDEEFLRRIYLDLTGTIPSATAARAFLDDRASDKRVKLIDALLTSPGYARHMQHVFDVVLLERQYGNNVTEAEWQEYLRSSFADNKPWDQLARELLGADGSEEKTRPATKFYMVRTVDSYRVLNPHHITRDIGRLFLGVNLQCAQCHDHPVIRDYKQADYYGIKAFVDRLYFVAGKRDNKPVMFLAEKPEGDASYHSVFDRAKVVKTAPPHLPGGKDVPDPALVKGREYSVPPAEGVLPVPAHSRRAQMVRLLTSADNVAFRRNAANRFWDLMMGRGLAHPVDLSHAANPPSHPELLDLLGRRFAEAKFDVRWLLRELALSRTYQLSSVAPSPEAKPAPETFAVAPLKPLVPAQLAFAVMQATGLADVERTRLGVKVDEKTLYASLAAHHLPAFVEAYGRPPGHAEVGFEASLFQALFLGNGKQMSEWLGPKPGNLTDRLAKLTDPGQVAEEMYMSTLSRRPAKEETAAVAEFLASRDKDRTAALQEMAWAMIASAEFRFNH